MQNLSPEWREFLKKHSDDVNGIVVLLVLTVILSFIIGSFFPWLFIPIAFIALNIGQDFVQLWLADESETQEASISESTLDETPLAETLPQRKSATAPQSAYSPSMQAALDRARLYQAQIESYIKTTTSPHNETRLQDLAVQIGEWLETLETMARQVDTFQQNAVIKHDLDNVPQSIKKLQRQLQSETSPDIKRDLEQTLASRQQQWETLQNLQNSMKQAEIKIENTLASLGTIYSQLLTSQSTNHVADYSRLSEEVYEEVNVLQDHLEALEEVKSGKYG